MAMESRKGPRLVLMVQENINFVFVLQMYWYEKVIHVKSQLPPTTLRKITI